MKKRLYLFIISIIISTLYNLTQAEEFDYTTITIDGQEIDCKYLAFAEPLNVHIVTGFEIKENIEDYPQWVQYYQYKAWFENDINRGEFSKKFLPSTITAKEYKYYNQPLPKGYVEVMKKRQQAVYERPENEQYKQLKGLFFYKKEDKEFVLLKFTANWAPGQSETGWAGIIDGEWKNYGFAGYNFFKDNIKPTASLFTGTTIHEKVIPLLEEKGKGLLHLEGNPLHFDLVTNTMMKQQPLAIINQFIDDVQTKVASLMNKEQPQSSNKVAHAQEATTSDIKPTFPWLWMVILILTFIVLVVLIRFKLKK